MVLGYCFLGKGKEEEKGGKVELKVMNIYYFIMLFVCNIGVIYRDGVLNFGFCVIYEVLGWELDYSFGFLVIRNFFYNVNIFVIKEL